MLLSYCLQASNLHDGNVRQEQVVPGILELFLILGSGLAETEIVDPADV